MDPRKIATINDYTQINKLYSKEFGQDNDHFDFIDELLATLECQDLL